MSTILSATIINYTDQKHLPELQVGLKIVEVKKDYLKVLTLFDIDPVGANFWPSVFPDNLLGVGLFCPLKIKAGTILTLDRFESEYTRNGTLIEGEYSKTLQDTLQVGSNNRYSGAVLNIKDSQLKTSNL
jgi:hypothetical protein